MQSVVMKQKVEKVIMPLGLGLEIGTLQKLKTTNKHPSEVGVIWGCS